MVGPVFQITMMIQLHVFAQLLTKENIVRSLQEIVSTLKKNILNIGITDILRNCIVYWCMRLVSVEGDKS